MNSLNMVDKIFLLVFFLSSLVGLFRGGVREIFSFLSWVAGFIVAAMFAHPLAVYLSHFSALHFLSTPAVSGVTSTNNATTQGTISVLVLGISALLLFFATVLVGSLIGSLANSAIEVSGVSFFNRLFGCVFGIARAYLLGLLVVFTLQLTPMIDKSEWKDSRIVQLYQPAVKWLSHVIQPSIDLLKDKINPTLENMGTGIQNKISDVAIPSDSTNSNN